MIAAICDAWEAASDDEPVRAVRCRTAICVGEPGPTPRFAYVSAASPVEQVLGDSSKVIGRDEHRLAVVELGERLLDGEVAAVLTAPGSHDVEAWQGSVVLAAELIERRTEIRREIVRARFLLRQIGLEEVSAHRGAHRQLYAQLAALWSHDLSMCIDPAMMVSLGADRQRYVDPLFRDRATERLPRAVARLDAIGVRSYPRLVIV